MTDRVEGIDSSKLKPGDQIFHRTQDFKYLVVWKEGDHLVLVSNGVPVKIRTEWICGNADFRLLSQPGRIILNSAEVEQYTGMDEMPYVVWNWVLKFSQRSLTIRQSLVAADMGEVT